MVERTNNKMMEHIMNTIAEFHIRDWHEYILDELETLERLADNDREFTNFLLLLRGNIDVRLTTGRW